jgi:hypothetical protein
MASYLNIAALMLLALLGLTLLVLVILLPVFVWQLREIAVRCERLLQQMAGRRPGVPERSRGIPGPGAGMAAYRQEVLQAAGFEPGTSPTAAQEQGIREAFTARLPPLEAAERLAEI